MEMHEENVKLCGLKISIIIPAFNEERLLGASLAVKSAPPPGPLSGGAGRWR